MIDLPLQEFRVECGTLQLQKTDVEKPPILDELRLSRCASISIRH